MKEQRFCAATAWYSIENQAAMISKATGKTVVAEEISDEEFKQGMPSFMAELFCEFLQIYGGVWVFWEGWRGEGQVGG